MDYEVEIRCGPQKACHFLFFYDKFGKYRAILIVTLVVHPEMLCGRSLS